MKNILARGGIEFLAVLLGITGSLWIDESQENKKLTIEVNQALHSIIQELSEIKDDFNRVLENY